MTQDQEAKFWEEYSENLKLYQEECDRHNQRILRAIRSVKGDRFYNFILREIEDSEGVDGRMRIESKPKGDKQDRNVWVNQTTNGGHTGDSFAGTVSVRLKKNKFLEWDYSM